MTANKRIVQLSLISFGLFLILATYFFFPKIIENKFLEEETVKDDVIKTAMTDSKERNTFENVEYKGLYDINKPFKVKSEKAYILIKDPDIIYMTNMHVTLHMDDGRVVINLLLVHFFRFMQAIARESPQEKKFNEEEVGAKL